MLFREYTRRFCDTILVLKKPATVATMSSHIRLMDIEFGNKPIYEIANSDVQRFITNASVRGLTAKSAKGLSPKSTKNLWSTLRLILETARKDGLIEKLPEPTLPKMRRMPQDRLTPEQMRLIINGGDPMFYHLLAETGMRIGEALGLQAENIAGYSLTINQSVFARQPQDPKTLNAVRTIAISKRLKSLLKTGSGYVFSDDNGLTPLSMSTVYDRARARMKSVGTAPVGFHAFRRGNATIMSQIGVPEKIAAGRLGHGVRGLTFGLYAEFVPGSDAEYVEKIAGFLT